MAKNLETVVYTTDASYKIIKAYETLDKLRKRFVYKKGKLAFMYSHPAYTSEDKQEQGALYKLLSFADIEDFCLDSSEAYETSEEQNNDHEGRFFGSKECV
jgi:hypothetical protein